MAIENLIAQLSVSSLPPLSWDNLPDWYIEPDNFRDTEYDLIGRLNGIIRGRKIEIGIFTDQDLVFGEQYDEGAAPQNTTRYVQDADQIARYIVPILGEFGVSFIVRGLSYGGDKLYDDLPTEQRIGVLARDAVPEHPELRREAAASLKIIIKRPLRIKHPIHGLVGFQRGENEIVDTIQPQAVGGAGTLQWSLDFAPEGVTIDADTGTITVDPIAFTNANSTRINVKVRVRSSGGARFNIGPEESEATFPILRWTAPLEARAPDVVPTYTRPISSNVLHIPITSLFHNVHHDSATASFRPPRLHARTPASKIEGKLLKFYLPDTLSTPVQVEINVSDATGNAVIKTIEISD